MTLKRNFWYFIPFSFSITLFLLIPAVGSSKDRRSPQKDDHLFPWFPLSNPDATYESLRGILEVDNGDYPQRDDVISEAGGSRVKSPAFIGRSNASSTLPEPVSYVTAVTSTIAETTTATKMTSTAMTTTTTTAIMTTTTTAKDYYCIAPGIPSDVVVIPETDQTWAVGSTHNVSCLINPDSGITSGDVFLSMGFQKPPIPHQVQDNYTITATVSETKAGSYKLMCMTETKPLKVCMRSVVIGYSPLDVKNLKCVSWNLSVLECNWTIPDNPAQPPSEDYLVYLVSSIRKSECQCSGGDGRCGSRSEGCMKTCCSWQTPEYAPAEQFLNISFSASNALGSAHYNHTINNWASVIPDKAEKITLKTSDSSLDVEVIWQMPVYIGTLASTTGIRYALEYRPDPDKYGTNIWQLGSTSICHAKSCHKKIVVEHPGAEYQLRVRLRAVRDNFTLGDDGWWSDWTPIECYIPPQRPRSPPSVGVGTFQVGTGNASVGHRDVMVAWRPLALLEQNGPNFTYIINATIDGLPLPETTITNTTYVTYSNISDESHLRMNIISSNSIGSSATPSEVEIMPARLMPPTPTLQVVVYHSESQQFELTWNDEDITAYYYTVYICTDKLESKDPCKANLYWRGVGNVTSVNMTLGDFGLEGLSNKDVRFALSSETSPGGVSSGMSWDNCNHPWAYRQSIFPPTVSDSIPTVPTSANVSWSLGCQDRGAVVEAVIAQWCQGSQNFSSCDSLGKKKETNVISGRVILTELEPDTEYSVRLRVQYRQTLSGWSSYKSFTTSSISNPGMALWLIGTIAIGCVVMAVFLVLCYSYSKGKIKELIITFKRPIKVPTGLMDALPNNDSKNKTPSSSLLSSPYAYISSNENVISESTKDTVPADSTSEELDSSRTRQVVNGGRSLAVSNKQPENSEENENLIQQTYSSSRSPSQSSGNLQPSQMGNNYVQIDFPIGALLKNVSAEVSEVIPQLSEGYVAIDYPAVTTVSGNGCILQEDVNNEEPRSLKAKENKGNESEHELSEMYNPSPGYVSVQSPNFGNVGGNGCVSADFPGEITSKTYDQRVDSDDMSLVNTIPSGCTAIQGPNFANDGKNTGYVALGETNTNGFLPELLQQMSYDSGFIDGQAACPTLCLSVVPKILMHGEYGHTQQRVSDTNIENKTMVHSTAEKSFFTREGNGYVEHPVSYDEVTDYGMKSVEKPGKEILPKEYDTDIKDRENLPSHSYVTVDGFNVGHIVHRAIPETDALEIDPEIIKSIALKYDHSGYVRDLVNPSNAGAEAIELQQVKSDLPLMAEKNAVPSYVTLRESSLEAPKSVPPNGLTGISDEYLCDSVDLGDAKNILSSINGSYGITPNSLTNVNIKNKDSQENETYSLPQGYVRVGEAKW